MTNYSQKYEHWHIEKDKEGRIRLQLDRRDKPVNSINPSVLDELAHILSEVKEDANAKGIILSSKKENGFILGADVDYIAQLTTSEQISEFVEKGQAVLMDFEELPLRKVAMVKGACFGGGLELALCCDYIIACEEGKTVFALPEIKLGIIPGWGGTQRLPARIGSLMAMDMILTGRAIDARKAKKVSLADDTVPLRQLERAAIYYLDKAPKKKASSFMNTLVDWAAVRPLLANRMRAKVMQHAKPEHYPAPYRVIDNWKKYGVNHPEGFKQEIKTVVECAQTPTAKNLFHVYALQQRLKSAKKSEQIQFEHIHVIGLGTMGAAIATELAVYGYRVTIQDREEKTIAQALMRAHQRFEKKFQNPLEKRSARDRLIPDMEGYGIQTADLIIEAVFEDLQIKQNIFKELEDKAREDALFASNTSSIPLDEINTVLKNRERLVGIHFFNPVDKMPLVEVVKGEWTDETLLAKVMSFVTHIGHLPLRVKSAPGFLINRILMPYMMEAMYLLDEGVPAAAIDSAAESFGMPMGPIELADTVGLDICLSVAKNLSSGEEQLSPKLLQLVEEKKLGKKTGQGFYSYRKGKPIKTNAPTSVEAQFIEDRLISRLLIEAFACLDEKIVENADLLDAGMIFGTGFAPFRGGLIHYARSLPLQTWKKTFSTLSKNCGKRFDPIENWERLLQDA